MTLFNDLWKTLKETPSTPSSQKTNEPSSKTPRTTEQVLNDFQQVELENLEKENLAAKLKSLKDIVDQPKEEKPEIRFTQIKQQLGPSETHETVRQERWPQDINCPKCQSTHLKRLPPLPSKSAHNHRYECLNCGNIFNDDSGTPMEQGIPPLNIWMQCWYLMGCTDSLNFIAHKLGLDITIVEMMVDRLQKTFLAQKPLTKFMGFDEWSKQSQHLRAQLKEDLIREYELLNANVATVPKDTAEFRRQQNIRRELTPSILPPSPTGGGRKR
jgi:transposase-like protein